MVSTPTAATRALNNSWEQAQNRTRIYERVIFGGYQELLLRAHGMVQNYAHTLQARFGTFLNYMLLLEKKIREGVLRIDFAREHHKRKIAEWSRLFVDRMGAMIERERDGLTRDEALLALHNPERQLALGYSIARIGGKIIRSVRDAHIGDSLAVALADGIIDTEIIKTNLQ